LTTIDPYPRKVLRIDPDGSWVTFNAELRWPDRDVRLYNDELGLDAKIPGARFEELRLQQEKSRQASGYARPAVIAIPPAELTILSAA
jgi:hypothetical protein